MSASESPAEHLGLRPGDGWFGVETDDPEVWVFARIEQEGRRVWASAVAIAKRDGSEIRARDLRRSASLREAVATVRTLQGFDPETSAKPAHPGPQGHGPEHWSRVWKLWNEAQQAAPGREIAWMRQQWDPPVPDATMRRWRDRARTQYSKPKRRKS